MARLVLHIGTHKTGTTMIQNRMHAARAALADQGVIYPAAGRHTGHHMFLTDWIALPAAYHQPEGGLAGLSRLADRWRATDATVILSSEEFSRAGGRGGQVDFAALRQVFHGYRIRVICVLRNQWQFLQAVYLELSQSAPPPPPADLVAGALKTGQVDGLWCDYLCLYDGLRSSFAAGEIRLVDYAAASETPRGLLGEVLRQAAPNAPLPELGEPDSRANVSPPPLPVWAAHVVAGGPSPGQDIRAAAEEAWHLEFGSSRPGTILTRAEIARLHTRFADGNDRLANRVRGIQPGWHLSDRPPPDTTLFREEVPPEYWIRLARRLAMRTARAAA